MEFVPSGIAKKLYTPSFTAIQTINTAKSLCFSVSGITCSTFNIKNASIKILFFGVNQRGIYEKAMQCCGS
jgi:hypothetical protein